MQNTPELRQSGKFRDLCAEQAQDLELANYYLDETWDAGPERCEKAASAIYETFGSKRVTRALDLKGRLEDARCRRPTRPHQIARRRPAPRAPARSIGLRTKSTRKRAAVKAGTSIDDPVSPRRASSGGAL